LREANLRETDLRGANLLRSKLDGASLNNAKYSNSTQWPSGFNPEEAGAELFQLSGEDEQKPDEQNDSAYK
jgi:uncharacterized protein YjbI with pentapeptide repeats